ncbi:MAG: HNH endonuclease [Gammaproteobacteria bacterium]|nr:HNH endonuclease [Gammaproteobacteria bacterium]
MDLPITEFHNDRSRPDGLYSYCKECNYKNSRKYIEKQPGYYAEYQRQYRLGHLEKLRAYGREHSKKRYQQNKHLWLEYCRTRRARVRANGEALTLAAWRRRLNQIGEKCIYCGAPYESIDHIIPVSKSGSDATENLVPSCLTCNLSKYNLNVLEWFARQPFCTPESLDRINALYQLAQEAQQPD